MQFTPLDIAGAYEIRPRIFRDDRGTFTTVYEASEFVARGLVADWTGDNQSVNYRTGILRGFHFQRPPHAQTKLVRAVTGRAFDVFVDLRTDSPTYLRSVGIVLDGELCNTLYIPKGCGHAYLTLTDYCAISYKVDHPYAPASEGGLRWNDPGIGFEWGMAGEPLLSDKDRNWPLLKEVASPFPGG
ncbi:MAG: dTDP-4-dehydrorhamnose 3,5-epimerase [Calditrichaeota bacterium]|nr:dTDP-4-dehydrorhamnose 3,5-epimerase [Calditrichota bacterium]